jgi:hypothetical protein
MVAIHLDANYIFDELIKNRMEGETIKVYQKIINRMKAAGLGLKSRYSTTNARWQWRHASKKMTWTMNSSPRDNTGKTRQSDLFKHSNPTSSLSWPASMTNSPYCFGATYLSQQNSP